MKRRARRASKHAAHPAPPTEAALDILEIGSRGDGVAEGPIYAPFTLPGERVRARVRGERAELIAVEIASPERVAPACPHFGCCGGCQLQHWAEAPYLAWKREELVRALGRRGIEAEVAAIVAAWGEGRRRAAFHARRDGKQVRFGFIERGGARIETVEVCPVLAPALARAISKLRALADVFAPAKGEIIIQALASETGLDVAVEGAGRPGGFDLARLEAGAALAQSLDLARLSFDGEALAARREPIVTMGAARVTPPPGAFLQATAEGERVLSSLVLEATAGVKRVADLFSGVGTFALRLAARAETHAAEGDADMLKALKRAAEGAPGLKPMTVETRDLSRNPVSAVELRRFDAVVFDPPRAGARLQAEEIAASDIARVAAVSCDPATFARDVRILIDAGFRLTKVTPVDQFRWSPHVEAVGVLER
jgi:23S rRNA (uracil1939-C5)-methyltransferase